MFPFWKYPMIQAIGTFLLSSAASFYAWWTGRGLPVSAAIFVVGSAIAKLFSLGGVCRFSKDLTGKIVVVTGGNTGVGLESGRALARMGGTVVLACRSMNKANTAVEDIKRSLNLSDDDDRVSAMELDLANMRSIRTFAAAFRQRYGQLDILLNNAGVMTTPYMKTEDGFEMQFGTNHLGHFLLTRLLEDLIIAAPEGRVVNVASLAQVFAPPGAATRRNIDTQAVEATYDKHATYGMSKAANIMFTRTLQKRFNKTNATAYALHPGYVNTELIRHVVASNSFTYALQWLFAKSPSRGAQTSIYCCISPDAVAGSMHADCAVDWTNPDCLDDKACEELWEYSEELVGLA